LRGFRIESVYVEERKREEGGEEGERKEEGGRVGERGRRERGGGGERERERWILTPGTMKNDPERRTKLIYGSTAFDISSSKADNFYDVSSSVTHRTFSRVMRLFVQRKVRRIVNFLLVTLFDVVVDIQFISLELIIF